MRPPLLRPLTLEYQVTGRLDGVTPAPVFAIPPSPAAQVDDDQIIRTTVENLGLINLTGGGPNGGTADRLVKWLLIYGPVAPSLENNVAVAYQGVRQRNALTIPRRANGLWSRVTVMVPQGGQLLLDGLAASAFEPITVRLQVWQPQTVEEWTAMIQASCCVRDCVIERPETCRMLYGVYTTPNCARTITAIAGAPVAIARGATATVNVTGSGFSPDDEWRVFIEANDVEYDLLINNVTFNSVNSVDLDLAVQDDAPVGEYTVTVRPPLGSPRCTATFNGGVQVTL